eukprot:IDg10911t1
MCRYIAEIEHLRTQIKITPHLITEAERKQTMYPITSMGGSSQKEEYFLNTLGEPARTFLLTMHKPDMKYENKSKLMLSEYNSNARKIQVRRSLEALKLDRFMKEHEIASTETGLTQLVEHIED